MSSIKITKNKAGLAILFIFTLAASLNFIAQPDIARAANVNCNDQDGESKTICEASIRNDACTNKDDAKSKACRKGFREGYKDPSAKESTVCKDYDGDEKNACKDGLKKGKSAAKDAEGLGTFNYNPGAGDKDNQCGNLPKDKDNFDTKFDFGCLGEDGPPGLNPIADLIFAFVRFLSVGVGIVIILALIMAGIQYSASEGNPEASAKAKKRAQNAIIGLLVYMFAWAILQFIIPGGFFK